MTPEEKSELVRVAGPDFDEFDVPAFIRQREAREELNRIDLDEKIANEMEDQEQKCEHENVFCAYDREGEIQSA